MHTFDDVAPMHQIQKVANTAKRALLIILSIMWFSNAVTMWNITGVFIVVCGVFM